MKETGSKDIETNVWREINNLKPRRSAERADRWTLKQMSRVARCEQTRSHCSPRHFHSQAAEYCAGGSIIHLFAIGMELAGASNRWSLLNCFLLAPRPPAPRFASRPSPTIDIGVFRVGHASASALQHFRVRISTAAIFPPRMHFSAIRMQEALDCPERARRSCG